MAKDRTTVTFTVSGDELDRLKEFQVDNGYPSVNAAARGLMFGAIAIYPTWGVTKAMLKQVTYEIRQRLLLGMHAKLAELHNEIETELATLTPPTESGDQL